MENLLDFTRNFIEEFIVSVGMKTINGYVYIYSKKKANWNCRIWQSKSTNYKNKT